MTESPGALTREDGSKIAFRRVEGEGPTVVWLGGFHSVADFPQAETLPGLLLYRFNANLLFFNVDYFTLRLRARIRSAASPVSWVIVDLSPVSFVDATAVQRFEELRERLGVARNILATRLDEMVAEATRNARASAEQFATDSGSRLGAIRSASQGVFQILARDEAPGLMEPFQIAKRLRVVSTVEYFLTD